MFLKKNERSIGLRLKTSLHMIYIVNNGGGNVSQTMSDVFHFSFNFYSVCSQLQVESRSSKCPSFCPSVPLNLLQFLSNSFNIAHRTSLQCCGCHERIFFFFRVIFGPFPAIFKAKKGLKIKIHWILSIWHTGYRYNIAIVIKEKFYDRVIFGPFSAIFRLKKASNSKFIAFFQYRTHGIVTISRAS